MKAKQPEELQQNDIIQINGELFNHSKNPYHKRHIIIAA